MARSSVAAASLAAIALVSAAVAAAPASAVTGTTTAVSFRNSRPLLPAASYNALLNGARALSCAPALPPGVKPPPSFPPSRTKPRKVGFKTALAAGRKAAGLKGTAPKKLQKNAITRTAVGAERLAAVGILKGEGGGALAALLTVAARKPRDPLPLIDAAALLIDAGKPNEALALLAQAQKLPQRRLTSFDVPTIAVSRRIERPPFSGTGQYTAAAAAGRRALQRSPGWSRRARTGRWHSSASAGWPRRRVSSGRPRSARWRRTRSGSPAPARAPRRPSDFADTPAAPGVYPPIGYPALAEKADGYVDYYNRLDIEANARFSKANDEYNRLTLKLLQPKPHQLATSRNRASDMYLEMLRVPLKARYTAAVAQGHAIGSSIISLAAEVNNEVLADINQCAGSLDPNCLRNKCKPQVNGGHTVFLARQTQLETLMRKWWHDLHAEMLGYAQGIADPDEHARAITQIDTQGLAGWGIIRSGIPAWNGTAKFLEPACLVDQVDPPTTDPTVGPDGTPLQPCPPALDQLKAKFDIAKGKVSEGPFTGASVGASVSVKCSEVSISADASWSPVPLLSGFGKLQYAKNAQGGTLTIAIGSKGSIGPASFTSGLQLTLSQHAAGTNVDLAWKVGPSIGSKSDIVDISIIKSVATPLTSPAVPSG